MPGDPSLTDVLIGAANQQQGFTNPSFALYKYAQAKGFGAAHTCEFEVQFGADTYVCQVYDTALVYVKKGDWGNCNWIPYSPNY